MPAGFSPSFWTFGLFPQVSPFYLNELNNSDPFGSNFSSLKVIRDVPSGDIQMLKKSLWVDIRCPPMERPYQFNLCILPNIHRAGMC